LVTTRRFGGAVLALVAASACSDDSAPTQPVPDAALEANRSLVVSDFASRGIESDFVALEARLPGFGGFYLDAAGDIAAYVRDPSDATRQAIADAFLGTEEQRNTFMRADGSLPSIRLATGEYSMSQLIDWSRRIRTSAGADLKIVQFDADERHNRVSIGIENRASDAGVFALAEEMGIPRGALHVYSMERPVATASLTDKVRPLVAGYLTTNFWSNGLPCSLGHPVTLNGTSYFLTASHCIPNFTGSTGADIFQDGNSITEKVGDVVTNPAWATSGCSAMVNYCTDADVALVDVDAGITASKKVAESSSIGTDNNAGNLTVGSTYTIGTQETSLGAGTEVYHTGASGGTTKGNIDRTCVAISYSSSPMLEVTCATKGDFRANQGDSGGPVYRWRFPLVPTSRSALGVVFAASTSGDRKTWYSPMGKVIDRLGSVRAY